MSWRNPAGVEMARRLIQLLRRKPKATSEELREFAKECKSKDFNSIGDVAEQEAKLRELPAQ